MDGNCKDAQAGFGKNEMYPCIDEDVTYGLAVTGLAVANSETTPLLPVSLTVDTVAEPDVRRDDAPVPLHGVVEVTGLQAAQATGLATFALYRFASTAALPENSASLEASSFEHRTLFTVDPGVDSWTFDDPDTFESNSATYYVASVYSPN
jgi:hypothetical protein